MVNPYDKDTNKKEQVGRMFDNIAHRYDFLNHFLSAGIDHKWRAKAVKQFGVKGQTEFLDVATGTGDLAIEIHRQYPNAQIKGIDLSAKMIEFGKEKIRKKELNQIELMCGDAESLPFESDTFDGITVGFGVRNFENLQTGLKEMLRVLKKGGKLVVLEFSTPRGQLFKPFFQFYFKYILPIIGKSMSKDPKAYNYLFKSVQVFPAYESFMQELTNSGFKALYYKKLTFGVCCLYVAEK